MKTRWMAVLGGLALIGAIALMGVGMAQAQGATGGFGPWATGQNATQQTPAGWWGPMMGGNQPNESYGPGGMMGGNGMMSGYGSAQQNPASAAPVSGNTVTIQNFAFQPANVQVTVGTTVTWTNNDTAPHTVTFRDGSLTSSGILRQGDTYSYTFTKVGTFSYYCAVHTYMIGEVIVTAR